MELLLEADVNRVASNLTYLIRCAHAAISADIELQVAPATTVLTTKKAFIAQVEDEYGIIILQPVTASIGGDELQDEDALDEYGVEDGARIVFTSNENILEINRESSAPEDQIFIAGHGTEVVSRSVFRREYDCEPTVVTYKLSDSSDLVSGQHSWVMKVTDWTSSPAIFVGICDAACPSKICPVRQIQDLSRGIAGGEWLYGRNPHNSYCNAIAQYNLSKYNVENIDAPKISGFTSWEVLIQLDLDANKLQFSEKIGFDTDRGDPIYHVTPVSEWRITAPVVPCVHYNGSGTATIEICDYQPSWYR